MQMKLVVVFFYLILCNNVVIANDFITWRGFLSIRDIEVVDEPMSVTPTLKIECISDISEEFFVGYIQGLKISEQDGQAHLLLKYGSTSNATIRTLNEIVDVSIRLVNKYHPVEYGELFIIFYYSSKNDDWLELPLPPPPTNMPW